MTCTELQRWLDEGRPQHALSTMNAHAATCARCTNELQAAMELERLLGVVVPAKVSAGFNDAVLRRIENNAWRRTLAAVVQVLAEPLVPLSLALTIILAWQFRTVSLIAVSLIDRMALAGTTHPELMIGVALSLSPFLFWLSWQLFRATFADSWS